MGNLVRALRDKMRMLSEDARAVARVVEDAFRGGDAVDDEDLDAEMRQLFYDLQDAQVLDVQRREYQCDGRLLRGYTWHVNEAAHLDHPAPVRPHVSEEEAVYDQLPVQAWNQRRRP